ncbi:TPA: hypothetical protein ACRNKC_000711 [Pseudomonas aeruginosa]|nr:hypothetical protein [Pseudomonas aeruginosa]MCS8369200.1 hypothetical protein [Pseudomonas aeruginosa]
MIKRNLNDLLSFVAVAREGTFTRGHAEIRGKFIHLECKPLL